MRLRAPLPYYRSVRFGTDMQPSVCLEACDLHTSGPAVPALLTLPSAVYVMSISGFIAKATCCAIEVRG